ncbi:MAG TPA: type II TA system antitoxin MqsA family protein [Longimicrobiaceae bacterium]|nr:type II TA system antitoxin MqsA family protein [Longimicrobiaceae bacterium]
MSECALCGGDVQLIRERRKYRIKGRAVEVEVEFSRCGRCGEEQWTDEQVTQGQIAAAAVLRKSLNLLSPDEILRIRKSLGLTQDDFERLLGAGKKTAVRWERGILPPSSAMNELIWLIGEDRKNAERLALKHGVRLPRAASAPAPAALRRKVS